MSRPKKFNPTDYKNDFQRNNYDRIAVQVKKDMREPLRQIAESKGHTLNGYIKRLLEQDTGLDL